MSLIEKKRIYLSGITSAAWEHPADRAALRALQKIPVLDTILRAVLSPTAEKSIRLATLASAVRVSPRQFKRIYALHEEACRVLDVQQLPELYISQNPVVNAYAVGWDNPFIVLNSSLIQTLRDEDEIIGVIGHEIGHIKSGHVLYKTLLQVLVALSQIAFRIPFTDLALQGLIIALREWDRKSELSADRAEALTSQNPDAVTRSLMKITGGSMIEEMDLGEFIAQAEEYRRSNSMIDSMHKVVNTLYLTHPFPVIRVLELINWVRGGEYEQLLQGAYKHKQTSSYYDDVKEAAGAYQSEFKQNFGHAEELFAKVDWDDAAKRFKDFFGNFNLKL